MIAGISLVSQHSHLCTICKTPWNTHTHVDSFYVVYYCKRYIEIYK